MKLHLKLKLHRQIVYADVSYIVKVYQVFESYLKFIQLLNVCYKIRHEW